MKKAVINPQTNEVENIIVSGDGFSLDGFNLVPCDNEPDAVIGGTYENGIFVNPNAEPEEVPSA